MIKFSNIVNQKINSEPKLESSKEELEVESFRYAILGLLDRTLVVRNEGSYKHAMIVTKIDGKEMFVEALMDFLSQNENKKAINYLESLKESNGDWKSIDEKITQIQEQNDNTHFLNSNPEHVAQIKSFLDKYSASDDFNEILEHHVKKITDYDNAITRIKVANIMLEDSKFSKYPKGRIRSIINKFTFRSKQLENGI